MMAQLVSFFWPSWSKASSSSVPSFLFLSMCLWGWQIYSSIELSHGLNPVTTSTAPSCWVMWCKKASGGSDHSFGWGGRAASMLRWGTSPVCDWASLEASHCTENEVDCGQWSCERGSVITLPICAVSSWSWSSCVSPFWCVFLLLLEFIYIIVIIVNHFFWMCSAFESENAQDWTSKA